VNALAYLEHVTPPVLISIDPAEIRGIIFWECLRYALVDSERRIDPLLTVYRGWAKQVTPGERVGLLERLTETTRRNIASARAFAPFEEDPDPHIVRVAYRTQALVIPTEGEDELRGPRLLLSSARSTTDRRTRVGILGGLLALGDRRVSRLLQGAWQLIIPDDAAWLWPERGGMVLHAAVEFFLSWTDQYDAASGALLLAQMANGAPDPEVWDVQRKFPLQTLDGQPDVRVLGRWPLPAYARQLLVRLVELETIHGSAVRPAVEAWARVAAAPSDQ
jgi:hypothetical protein